MCKLLLNYLCFIIQVNLFKFFLNGEFVSEVEVSEFVKQADYIFKKIKNAKGRTFPIEKTEDFMHSIYVNKIKAASNQKADILIQIKDINTGYTTDSGFSIKSDFSSKSTLINSSEATNFIFKINGFDKEKAEHVNNICDDEKIKNRINYIRNNSCAIEFIEPSNEICKNNLMIVDSLFPEIVGWAIFYYYSENTSGTKELVNLLEERNPLNYQTKGMYIYKFKKFLAACALGMRFAQKWNGVDDANGGYIVVKGNGDILAYHIYNRNAFEDFLLNSTKFERGSTTKHKYCYVYEKEADFFIKLNLAIRFK